MRYLKAIEQFSKNKKIKFYAKGIVIKLPFIGKLSIKAYENLKKQLLNCDEDEVNLMFTDYPDLAIKKSDLTEDVNSLNDMLKDIIRTFKIDSFKYRGKYYMKLYCDFSPLDSYEIYDLDEFYDECFQYIKELIDSNLAKIEEGDEICFV